MTKPVTLNLKPGENLYLSAFRGLTIVQVVRWDGKLRIAVTNQAPEDRDMKQTLIDVTSLAEGTPISITEDTKELK